MQLVFIDARFEGEVKLGDEVLTHIKDNNVKSVALFASVNFLGLDIVKKQLIEAGCDILTTKAKRTHVPTQILGCDSYEDSYEEDIISKADMVLYVGDGMFHPKALLLSQTFRKDIKDVIIWDPVAGGMKVINRATIQKQLNRTKGNLTRFLVAQTIGVLVTTKPGQQYLHQAQKLKEHLKTIDKKCYVFISDTIDIHHLENYPFIDAWVNTACPRIGQDDITTITKPMINIKEAFDPGKALEDLA